MSKAPAPYQPPNQAGAATAFQAGAGQLGQQGSDLYNTVSPEYQRVYDAVKNNPYYAQAMQGVQQAAGQATSTVAPQQFAGAAQNAGVAGMAASAAPVAANAAYQGGQQGYSQAQSMLPTATAGAGYAPQVASYLMGQIPGLTSAGVAAAPGVLSGGLNNASTAWNQGQAGAAAATGNANTAWQQGQAQSADSLAKANTSWSQSQDALRDVNAWNTPFMSAAGQTLNTAYDPQKDLYNRSFQQNAEQTNAINAQNGVVGSPFAAGVASDQSRNFNIDWDNAQLQRQIAALGAYGTAEGTATGAVNNTLTTGANNFATLSGDARGWADSGATNYANLSNTARGWADSGATNYGNLVNSATGAYTNLTNSAANNISGLTNSAVGDFNSLNNSATDNAANLISTGSSALNTGINTGVGALNSLGATTIAGNQSASDLNRAGLNTLTTASAAPSTVYQQQQGAELAALNAQTTGTNAASAQQQTSVGDQGDYLKIGQSATTGAQAAAKQNNALIGDVLSGVSTIAGLIPW